jgi:hypothetical protein
VGVASLGVQTSGGGVRGLVVCIVGVIVTTLEMAAALP